MPDEAKNSVDLAIDEIKANAGTSTDPVPTIFQNVMAPLYDMGLDKVTKISYNSVKTSIYAKRKRDFKVKKLKYNNVEEVEIPATFNELLMADYNCDGIRVIVFCSKNFKPLLYEIDEYYGDGTFQSAPVPFYQLYTIHGNFGSTSEITNIVPLIYCLMSDKTEESYVVLFKMIKAQCPHWEPKIFHSDFETAMTNALKKEFPRVTIKGCYYHYLNALWRKAKFLGLKTKMNLRIVGLCKSLPLLPVEYINEGWNYIQSECHEMQEVKPFVTYMNKYWLKNYEFIKEWCVYNQLHRTNNFAEGWHARLNRVINKNYVTIAKLLSVLVRDISINKMAISNAKTGHSQNKRQRLLKERDTFIINTQMSLIHKEISVGHFLEKLR